MSATIRPNRHTRESVALIRNESSGQWFVTVFFIAIALGAVYWATTSL